LFLYGYHHCRIFFRTWMHLWIYWIWFWVFIQITLHVFFCFIKKIIAKFFCQKHVDHCWSICPWFCKWVSLCYAFKPPKFPWRITMRNVSLKTTPCGSWCKSRSWDLNKWWSIGHYMLPKIRYPYMPFTRSFYISHIIRGG
jgi:hypothetical protein